jgi:transcriptional regulator with XRE-family HTH domain
MDTKPPALGTTYQSVLGAVINSLRSSGDRNITQAEIAKRLGVTVSTWSRIERGESPLTIEQLLIVALFFDLPLSALFKNVEGQMESLKSQGISVAISKDALIDNNVLQLSNLQLISSGLIAATPFGFVGLAAYSAYKALLKVSKNN